MYIYIYIYVNQQSCREEFECLVQRKRSLGLRCCYKYRHTIHTHTHICEYTYICIYIHTCMLVYISNFAEQNSSVWHSVKEDFDQDVAVDCDTSEALPVLSARSYTALDAQVSLSLSVSLSVSLSLSLSPLARACTHARSHTHTPTPTPTHTYTCNTHTHIRLITFHIF